MTLLVTGGYGFIGANIIHAVNATHRSDIIVVDDLSEKVGKFKNLISATFLDYWDKTTLLSKLASNDDALQTVSAIVHLGACSDTMNHDGKFMMENNFEYTKALFHFAQHKKIPFIYASSAATYGNSTTFKEQRDNENPLNIYGYSKLLFDRYIDQYRKKQSLVAPVFGLRYFNVYGPYENHKERMASVAFHHYNQINKQGYVELFGEYDGVKAGEQRRDFVYVGDVVKINLWLLEFSLVQKEEAIKQSGYFNVGTGSATTFNELSLAVVNSVKQQNLNLKDAMEAGYLRYVEFPDSLKGKYQSYTKADINRLRELGYTEEFYSVNTGIAEYVQHLISLS